MTPKIRMRIEIYEILNYHYEKQVSLKLFDKNGFVRFRLLQGEKLYAIVSKFYF